MSNQALNLENAIADVKRQLRTESKSELIRKFIGLYAQMVGLQFEIRNLKEQLNKQAVTSASQTEVVVNVTDKEAVASATEGVKND